MTEEWKYFEDTDYIVSSLGVIINTRGHTWKHIQLVVNE